jgi:thiol-disulfide isomerase/thioredoxin
MVKRLLPLVLLTGFCAAADANLVKDVRAAVAQQDYSRAAAQIQSYRSTQGETPESILALSWMARGALGQKQYQQAEAYAEDTYRRALILMKKRPLDQEPKLPTALGAAIEVQGQLLAAQGQRSEAVAYLSDQLKKYAATSMHARIQKNINLLSLEGKPAPKLQGVSLPAGKPALLFFWAHWCGDCRAEAPILARLKKEFGPQGLAFIGPTQKYGYVAGGEEAPASVELPYIEKIRQQFYASVVDPPATVSEKNFLNYGVSTTPTLAIVDRGGIVRLYHPGGMKYEELRPMIEAVLKKP